MKICLVSRNFDKNSGSAEWIYAEWLSNQLKKKGFEILEISQNKNESLSRFGKIIYDLIILPLRLLYARFFLKFKKFYFLSENQATFSPVLRLLNSKCYVESYDIMRTKDKKVSLDKIFFKIAYNLLRFNNKIICISSATKRDLIKEYNISSRKIEIVYPIYRSFSRMITNKKKVIIGYLGSLGGRKRTSFFNELEREIKRLKLKNLEIHIWGRGNKENLNGGEIMKLKGYALEEDLMKIYNSFDYFVFPSTYEGLGLPIIESSMCGKPSFIMSDAYFPDEIKDLCLLIKNPKELLKIIREMPPNSKKYNLESNNILKKCKRFSLETNLDKIIKIIT